MSFSRSGLVLLFVVSIFLSGCFQKKTIEPLTFSDGNGLTLEIQTLPEGIEEGDISILPLASTEIPVENPTEWKGYSLGPGGTEFANPVIVSLPFDQGVPTLFHVHAGEVSPIDKVTYSYSDAGNTASFEIDGFSAVLVHEAGPKIYDIELNAGDAHVGEYLPIRGEVNIKYETEYDGNTLVVRDDHDRTVRAHLEAEGPVSPGMVLNRPAKTLIKEKYTLVSDQDFKCDEEGKVEIIYDVALSYRVDYYYTFLGVDWTVSGLQKRWPRTSYIDVKTTANCLPALPPEPHCGDGKVNVAGEQCDGDDLQGQSCDDYGFNAGHLKCSSTCIIDTEYCKQVEEDKRYDLSCAQNSRENESEFDNELHICRHDCPNGEYCKTETCTCHPFEEPEPAIDHDARVKDEINAIAGFLDTLNNKKDDDEVYEDDCDLPGVDCDDEEEAPMMQMYTPYTIICPNGEGRSGTYITDQATGEPVTNAAGEKLDSITGKPIPPCPPMR